MAGLTVGTLTAVLQLRAEQFIAANRQAQAGLQSTAAEATTTAAATERTDAAFATLGATTGVLDNRLKDTTGAFIASAAGADKAAIANTRLRTAQLQVIAAQERYDAVMASGTASTGEMAAAEARLSAAQTRVAVAANSASEALARQGAAAGTAAAETEAAAAKSTASASRGLTGVASTVAKAGALLGGVALVFSVAEIAKNGNEFTHAMNTLAAASGGTAEELAAARAQAIAMGKDLTIPKVTATDAAVAMEDLVKAGVSLQRSMVAARPALLLAAAANVDVADSARVTGDILDEWGFSADHATHVADVMATAANSAGGGLMDLFGAMKYVGPSARQLGVGFDYTTAALVELAKAGIQGSLAGTSLRNMLTRLTPSGGPAKAAITALGVSAFDATGKFKGLPVVIDQLHAAQERLSPQAFAADVSIAFGARALSAVQVFAHGGSAALQTFYNKLEAGNVQEFADKMNQGVGAGFSQLGKEFSAAGLDIYNAVQGPLSTAVHWIGEELPKAFAAAKTFITDVAHDASGVLAPAFTAVSAVFRTAGSVIGAVFGFLGSHAGVLRVIAEAAAGMYLAFKGYAVVTAASAAISAFTGRTVASLGESAGAVQAWGANWASVMAGTGTDAQLASAAVTAAVAEEGAALTASIAEADAALASEAVAWEELGAAAASAAAFVEAAAAESAAAAAAAAVEAEAAAGALVAAGEEASVGWGALLGPIGLVAAGLAVVGISFAHSGDKAKAASIGVDSFTSAIEKDSGALGTNTRAAVANQLATDGAFKSADKLGIGTDTLTDAVLHGGSALGILTDHLKTVVSNYDGLQTAQGEVNSGLAVGNGLTSDQIAALGTQAAATKGSADAAQSLLDELTGVSGGLADAKQASTDMATAMLTGGAAAQLNAQQTADLTQVVGGLAGASDKASMAQAAGVAASLAEGTAQDALQNALSGTTSAAKGLSDAIDALNGNLTAEQAENSFLDAQAQLQAALKDSGGSLDQLTVKGRAANEQFLSGVTAAQQYAIQQTVTTGSVQAGLATYQSSIDKLFATAAQAGATSGQMNSLRASVDSVPALKQILTRVLGDQAAKSQLAGVAAAVNNIPAIKEIAIRTHLEGTALGALGGVGGTPGASNPPALVPTRGGSTGSGHVTGGHAAGGLINLPGTGRLDTGFSPVANREFVERAAATNRFGVPFMATVNRGDMAGAAAMLTARGFGGNDNSAVVKAVAGVQSAISSFHDALTGAVAEGTDRTVDAIGRQSEAAHLRGVSTVSGRPY